MREEVGDLWVLTTARPGEPKPPTPVITTNGSIKNNGLAVMGKGTALQALQQYPLDGIDRRLGYLLRQYGNHVYQHPVSWGRLITFPVKHLWWQDADLELIGQSARELMELADAQTAHGCEQTYALPRPGCGNGNLTWEQVKPVVESILDDRFVVITNEP